LARVALSARAECSRLHHLLPTNGMSDCRECVAGIVASHDEHLKTESSQHIEQSLGARGLTIFHAAQFCDVDVAVVGRVEQVEPGFDPAFTDEAAQSVEVSGEWGKRRLRSRGRGRHRGRGKMERVHLSHRQLPMQQRAQADNEPVEFFGRNPVLACDRYTNALERCVGAVCGMGCSVIPRFWHELVREVFANVPALIALGIRLATDVFATGFANANLRLCTCDDGGRAVSGKVIWHLGRVKVLHTVVSWRKVRTRLG
jgi:hypothetical protein